MCKDYEKDTFADPADLIEMMDSLMDFRYFNNAIITAENSIERFLSFESDIIHTSFLCNIIKGVGLQISDK